MTQLKSEKTPLKTTFFLLYVFWTAVILSIVVWSIKNIYFENEKMAERECRASYEKDLSFRAWATMHGGVYVPITSETKPNPYLNDIAERDITLPSGKKLTLMNPAYMTRQVNELALKKYGIKGHITSRNPIRPENKPDPWEKEVLMQFESGLKEYSGFDTLDNKKYYRFMSPLIVEQGCLKCHSKQGYKLGEIRGGISTSLNWEPYEKANISQSKSLLFGYGGLWIIGIIGISLVKKKFVVYNNLRDLAEKTQQELFNELQISKTSVETALVQKDLFVTELTGTKKKLEQINSEKDKFFSIISHDLRSPFIGFLGLTSIMKDKSENLGREEFIELSSELNESANNLYKLLENLLEWSRIQGGLTTFNPRDINISEILNSNLTLIKDTAKQKEIQLIVNEPKDLKVFADDKMLNTIVRNLLSNALKFTFRGGKIIVSAKEVSEEYAEVSISDTGKGINQENINKLFDITEKVSTKGTEGESSSGLGLILCNEFIKKHNGEIIVESEVGKGSTFRFTIPKSKNNS